MQYKYLKQITTINGSFGLDKYQNVYMVRNHQDGYPYLNLALFFFLKISGNLNFFGKIDPSMNSGRRRAGDCQGYLKRKEKYFQTLQKMVIKLGQFKRLKCREKSRKNLHFFFFLKKISKLICFGKIDWSMNSEPRRAGGSQRYLKKIFSFSNSTKNGNKVRTN